MVRWESTHALSIKRIKNKDGYRKIKKREHSDGVRQQPARSFGGFPPLAAHAKLHFLSRHSERKIKPTTSSSMQKEIAAPKGQLYAAPNRLTTMFEIIIPLGPPNSSGARKSPRLSTKANVAPASTPGIERGKTIFHKVCPGVAPRSCEASTKLRGMCSSAA